MSALRAILGRFARFLVRIARRLDPGLTAAPIAVPERMAALRRRYPGAPDHWLELVSRSPTMMVEGGPGSAQGPDPELEPQLRTAQSPRAPHIHGRSGHFARPAPRFPVPTRRAADATGFAAATPDNRPGLDMPAAPRRSARPEPEFGIARARSRLANLLSGQRRKPRAGAPQFLTGDESPQVPPEPAKPGQGEPGRAEFQPTFPSLDARSASRPEWDATIGDRDSSASAATSGWPTRERTQASWPNEAPRSLRPNPRFAEPDYRWPALPALLDDFEMRVLRTTDEAALLAEQIGGKWSA